jgi:hypothetical protein
LIRLKARLQVSILKKINIIIWIILLSFVSGSHAGIQQIGNNEAPGNHSALKKLSPIKTPAFNGSRVIVRLEKNSPDKRQSSHKYDKLLKLRDHAIMQRLKQRTEERQATILQALEKNRRSFIKRSWIPFLRRQAKNPAPPLNSRSLWLANSIAVTVTKEDLEKLKKDPDVEEIVKNSILRVSPIALGTDENPLEGEELWNHTLIGIEAARELGLFDLHGMFKGSEKFNNTNTDGVYANATFEGRVRLEGIEVAGSSSLGQIWSLRIAEIISGTIKQVGLDNEDDDGKAIHYDLLVGFDGTGLQADLSNYYGYGIIRAANNYKLGNLAAPLSLDGCITSHGAHLEKVGKREDR